MDQASKLWVRVRAPTTIACALLALTAAACNDDITAGGSNTQDTLLVLVREPFTGRNPGGFIPATDGERLYAPLNGGISAYDFQSGAAIWTTPGVMYAPTNILVDEGKVFVAEAVARALDATTGAELWRFTPPTDASMAANALDESTFYIGTRDHWVYALSLMDGHPLWGTDIGPDWQFLSIIKGISASGDTLYVAAEEWRSESGHISTGWIVALDRDTGRTLWRYSTKLEDRTHDVINSPTIIGRLLLASDQGGGAFFAVDRFTGREVWRVEGSPGLFGPSQSPVVVDGIGYLGSNDENVYSFDPETGAILWKTHMPASIGAFAVCRDKIFVNYLGLGMLDRKTGKILVRRDPTEAEFFSSGFAVHDDRVFVIGNKYLYAFGCV